MPETAILARFNYIAILLCLLFYNCGGLSDYEQKQVEDALSDSLLSTTETWGVDLQFLEDGYLKLNLKGSYASTIQNDDVNQTRIEGPIHISVFDTTGAVESVVTSNRAVYYPENSEFELFGAVEVQTKDNRRLSSEYLKWERTEDQISSNQFVIIVTPTDSIAAQGFYGSSDLTDYTITEGSGETIID